MAHVMAGTRWSPETEEGLVFPNPDEIIREDEIHAALANTVEAAKDPQNIRRILQKARENAFLNTAQDSPQHEFIQALSLEETATLLNIPIENQELMQEVYNTALEIKQRIYGDRIVLFAPLYVSNFCQGSCQYCGYRGSNREMERSVLDEEDLKKEVRVLEQNGHKRLVVLCGEHPMYPFNQFLQDVRVIADVKTGTSGEIRRMNVEIPPLSVSDCKRLKATDCVGTYTIFQETYHRETYAQMHPRDQGTKSDYNYRLLCMDRAQMGGLDDVGLGALFGLYDYRFEVLGLLMHADHLERTYRCGPHTISVPRLQPAKNTPLSEHTDWLVNDDEFKKIVAIIRIAVPYTGMILSTRETPEIRRMCIRMGVSQFSAGSHTDVGSYSSSDVQEAATECSSKGQFSLSDTRTPAEVIKDLLRMGFVPSWCTACYRCQRTGEQFMAIAKKGNIGDLCQPNALLTLAEYLLDYADDEAKELGWAVIEREQHRIQNPNRLAAFQRKLERICNGERDLYF
eukprot:gnl/Trimastix_PCT/1187.p1 GENE.gnl/Trimastix_PCT/1187~~gnl/Trimastix_PCT/1187.p1  ORF type:complete len:513 (-),score=132.68 gnl/Trimastix_PCT/1187:197-1735(-)